MSKFEIVHASCADQEVDVVVNAANRGLWAGSGICGVIFDRAGLDELQKACSEYNTPLNDGDAVITPAFNMKNTKAIIHAVGPNFMVTPTAFKELFEAYYNSLVVMKENGYHSIAFPLISSGIFGSGLTHAVAESTKQCMRAYKKFTADYPDYDIDVKLCAFTNSEMQEATQEYRGVFNEVDGNKSDNNKRKIICFHNPDEENGYLSNWYMSDFIIDGISYSSMEQYMMYMKAVTFNDTESAKQIMAISDVEKIKALGRGVNGYNETIWNGMRQIIVYKGLLEKFGQNDELCEKLIDTGDAILAECAVSDLTWGIGISMYDDNRFDMSKWKGRGLLGFALMQVRDELNSETVEYCGGVKTVGMI